MRRPGRRPPPPLYATQVQAGVHYAQHVLQGEPNGPRYPLSRVDEPTMSEKFEDPATRACLGVPVTYDYLDGMLRIWPLPNDGWRVFSEVSGKDVTP